jgi:transposase
MVRTWEAFTMSRPSMLSDAQWAKIEPLLPKLTSKGRPWKDNRDTLEGILWVLKTGARWRDLPSGFPSGSTCWRRLSLWDSDGTWETVWQAFLSELDRKGWLDWEESFADATFAPAKKGATEWASPSGARARNACWWWTAREFLSRRPSTRPRRRRANSSRSRSA